MSDEVLIEELTRRRDEAIGRLEIARSEYHHIIERMKDQRSLLAQLEAVAERLECVEFAPSVGAAEQGGDA